MALTLRTVTAHYPRADLTPSVGYVTFTPTAPLASLADNTIVWPAQVIAGLDDQGDLQVDVLATGTGSLLPAGWVYSIAEHIDGATRPAWLAEIPAGSAPLDLADISPLVAQPDLVSYVLLTSVGQEGGPAGPLVNGLVPAEQIPGGGGGGSAIPATSVTSETTYGIAAAVGTGTPYARQDHTHGTPGAPTAASVGADPTGTATAAVSAHAVAADPHGDRAYADTGLAGKATTGHVHAGVYDPAGTAAAAVSAHTGAVDPHADRAFTTSAVSAHAGAADPHGDRAAATSALAAHDTDTTSVHGIADTAALETTTGAAAKVSAHAGAADPHGDRAFATSAVSTHSAATTSVHGIANTAALETTTGATTKVSTHAGAADPHADRAFTTSAVSTHAGAVDPHGDRAYADTRAPLAIIGTVTADQAAITGTTPTDVAGLGLAIPGAGTYDFDYYISYTGSVGGSNTTATNPSAQLNGPAVSFAGYVIEMQISNTTNNIFAKTTLASAQAPATNGISTALNPYTVRIRGRIIATGAGTLQPQIARAVGTFTGDIVVKAGSHATARKVA